MTRLTHEEVTKAHAMKRFRERVGINLLITEYNGMVNAIRSHNVPPVAVTMTGNRVFKVRVAGRSAYAVWARNQIATFYPAIEWVTERGGRVVNASHETRSAS